MLMDRRSPALVAITTLASVLGTHALPEIEVIAPRVTPATSHSTIYDEEELEAERIVRSNFLDLLPAVPNAYIAGDFSLGFTLRGLGQEGLFTTLGTNSNPLITATRDGIPLSSHVLTYLPPLVTDLQKLEISKGPQILGPGASSLGGTLRFTSPLPEFSFAGEAALGVAEYGFRRAHIAQNFVILPEELTLRLSSHWEESDGYLENITFGDHQFAATERQRHTASLLWRPKFSAGDSVLINMGYDGSRGNSLGNTLRLAGLIDNDLDRKTARNTDPSFPADHWFGSIKGVFALGNDLSLTSNTTFQQFDLDKVLDLDSSPLLSWYANGFNDEFRITQDFILEKKSDTLDWALGAYLESSSYKLGYSGMGVFPVPAGSPFNTTLDEDVTKYALFGSVVWKFAPDWKISGGLRALHERRDAEGFTDFLGIARASDSRKSSDAILPEMGIHWSPNEQFATGLRISRGYRGGGIAYAASVALAQPYEDESSWDAELYADYKPSTDLTVSLNLFASTIKNQQVAFTPAGGIPFLDQLVANSSSSRRYGMEIESNWKISDCFMAHAGLGWLHTEFRELQIQGRNLSGSEFSNAPELTASAGLTFRHPSGWYASSLFTWADTSVSSVQDAAVTGLESRKLLSARIGYSWDNLNLYLFGNNLLDDRYATARMLGVVVPSMNADIGAPRTIGIGCELTW